MQFETGDSQFEMKQFSLLEMKQSSFLEMEEFPFENNKILSAKPGPNTNPCHETMFDTQLKKYRDT